jgi:hypothetical protein
MYGTRNATAGVHRSLGGVVAPIVGARSPVIDDIIRHIAGTVPAVSGDDLTGFVIDAEHYFGLCRPFRKVEVEKVCDPLSIVTVHAQIRDDVTSVQEISHALSSALPNVAYNYFSACSVDWYKEATVLRFITVPGQGAYYVSGTVFASGPGYPELLAAFERDFPKLVQSWRGLEMSSNPADLMPRTKLDR